MKHFITIAVILFATALPLAAQNDPNTMDAEKFEKAILDIGDGFSLIYDIDPGDLTGKEAKGLAERMIPILRRRLDPANMANIKMIPRGDTRIEIQLPLADQTKPNTLPLTAEQIESTVLKIMAAHPEQFTHPAKTMTDEQFEQLVLKIVTNHPEIYAAYTDKTLDRAETYYNNRFSTLLWVMGIALAVVGIVIPIILSFTLEHLRKRSFKKEMAEEKAALQKDSEDKITEATQKLYTETAGSLATVYLGIASACKDSSYLRIISAIFAVDQALVGLLVDTAKDSLTWILKDIQLLNTTDLNKKEWETLDKNIRMVERNLILTDYPEISEILVQLGRITSHHIIQLKKETDVGN